MKPQPLVAELLGTFTLTLVVLLSMASSYGVPTSILAGLTVGLLVYVLGPISGAHFNPAVTIGFYSINKIASRDAMWYVVMQMLGAFLASWVGMLMLGDAIIAIPVDTLAVFVGEAMGAAVLILSIAAVVFKKVDGAAAGLTIGTGLAIGAHIASSVGNGVMNPAVALGIGSLSWMYAIGPVVGAVIAAFGYQWLVAKK
ncbi:MAG: aquaporin [Candidatus Peribacteraceae bacterium]